METTPDRIAHGRAMLNTINSHREKWHPYMTPREYQEAIKTLRSMYDFAEINHRNGLIRDPHPRQVGDRILPRWEWWLHRIAVRLGLGGAES